jgi:hypothetical protein
VETALVGKTDRTTDDLVSVDEITYTGSHVAKIVWISTTTLTGWERKGAIPAPTRIARNNECV